MGLTDFINDLNSLSTIGASIVGLTDGEARKKPTLPLTD